MSDEKTKVVMTERNIRLLKRDKERQRRTSLPEGKGTNRSFGSNKRLQWHLAKRKSGGS